MRCNTLDLDLDLNNLNGVDSHFKTFAESFCNGELNYYGMLTSEEMDRAYFSFGYFWGKDLGELDIIVKLMSGACTFVAENLPDDFPWNIIYSILCDAG